MLLLSELFAVFLSSGCFQGITCCHLFEGTPFDYTYSQADLEMIAMIRTSSQPCWPAEACNLFRFLLTWGNDRRVVNMAQPKGDSFTLCPGFMSGPQMRPGMSSVSSVSASPCRQEHFLIHFKIQQQCEWQEVKPDLWSMPSADSAQLCTVSPGGSKDRGSKKAELQMHSQQLQSSTAYLWRVKAPTHRS